LLTTKLLEEIGYTYKYFEGVWTSILTVKR